MINWPYDILDELLKNYTETPTDLTRFCIDSLGITASDRVQAKKIKDILETYYSRNFIEWFCYKWESKDGRHLLNTENNGPNKTAFAESNNETFENNRIEARLTSIGLDYAIKLRREKEQHDSILLTNDSARMMNKATIENYKLQKMVSGATIAITVMATIFSALVYFKNDDIKIKDWELLIKNQQKIEQSLNQLQQRSTATQIKTIKDSAQKTKK